MTERNSSQRAAHLQYVWTKQKQAARWNFKCCKPWAVCGQNTELPSPKVLPAYLLSPAVTAGPAALRTAAALLAPLGMKKPSGIFHVGVMLFPWLPSADLFLGHLSQCLSLNQIPAESRIFAKLPVDKTQTNPNQPKPGSPGKTNKIALSIAGKFQAFKCDVQTSAVFS